MYIKFRGFRVWALRFRSNMGASDMIELLHDTTETLLVEIMLVYSTSGAAGSYPQMMGPSLQPEP